LLLPEEGSARLERARQQAGSIMRLRFGLPPSGTAFPLLPKSVRWVRILLAAGVLISTCAVQLELITFPNIATTWGSEPFFCAGTSLFAWLGWLILMKLHAAKSKFSGVDGFIISIVLLLKGLILLLVGLGGMLTVSVAYFAFFLLSLSPIYWLEQRLQGMGERAGQAVREGGHLPSSPPIPDCDAYRMVRHAVRRAMEGTVSVFRPSWKHKPTGAIVRNSNFWLAVVWTVFTSAIALPFALNVDYLNPFIYHGTLQRAKAVIERIEDTHFGRGDENAWSSKFMTYAFTFTDADGRTRHGVSYVTVPLVDATEYDKNDPITEIKAGDAVTVKYPAGHPEAARIEGMRRKLFPTSAAIGWLFPLAGLALIVIEIRKIRRGETD
jgi:hypothetical protein